MPKLATSETTSQQSALRRYRPPMITVAAGGGALGLATAWDPIAAGAGHFLDAAVHSPAGLTAGLALAGGAVVASGISTGGAAHDGNGAAFGRGVAAGTVFSTGLGLLATSAVAHTTGDLVGAGIVSAIAGALVTTGIAAATDLGLEAPAAQVMRKLTISGGMVAGASAIVMAGHAVLGVGDPGFVNVLGEMGLAAGAAAVAPGAFTAVRKLTEHRSQRQVAG